HMACFTPLLVPGPLLEQGQAEIEQYMVVARDIPHVDPDLAVVDFASVTTPLALDAYRVGASLRKATGIKGDHPIGLTPPLDHLFDQHGDQRPVVPGGGADEVLDDPALDSDQRRDVLSILAWQVGQQPLEVEVHIALASFRLKLFDRAPRS